MRGRGGHRSLTLIQSYTVQSKERLTVPSHTAVWYERTNERRLISYGRPTLLDSQVVFDLEDLPLPPPPPTSDTALTAYYILSPSTNVLVLP